MLLLLYYLLKHNQLKLPVATHT